jgi:pyruvate carboxylase subunit B
MKQKRKIGITELVLRDGHQSLLATRMRTEDMLPICNRLDKSGFWSLEVWGGATFDACIRFLREDPWVRLRKLRRALPNTQLQMLLRGQNLLGYRHYADDVVAGFVERAAANGMDVFRVFDALNDFRNMRAAIDAVKKVEKHAQGTISYTTSPLHSIDVLAKLADDFTNAGCDSIAIKDMAGIITRSLSRATHFRQHSKTGCVTVNLPTAGTDYHVPFGGRKKSSYGAREQGRIAAEFYTAVKTAYTYAGLPD